jgi:hypothetical protein
MKGWLFILKTRRAMICPGKVDHLEGGAKI